jgi:hypothetical protein
LKRTTVVERGFLAELESWRDAIVGGRFVGAAAALGYTIACGGSTAALAIKRA